MTRYARRLLIVLAAPFALLLPLSAQTPPAAGPEAPAATEAPAAIPTLEERMPGVKFTHGPATVKLGTVAELKLPAGYSFVGADSLDRYYELTQNIRNGEEVGVVLADEGWSLFLDFDDVGYVKDDEKQDLDASKLLSALSEGQEAGNKARRERGWEELKLQGWATQPHYDPNTHYLKWALRLSSSSDQHQEKFINGSIRLLGRGGVMKVTVVASDADYPIVEPRADLLLTQFRYLPGQTYAEYRSGDKIAEYGLTALVLGGGAALAAKAGLFSKLWKFIVAAVVAIGVGLKRLFGKLTGRAPTT